MANVDAAHTDERIKQLLDLARSGDRSAFDVLLEQYQPLIEHQLAAVRSQQRSVILPEDEKDLRQEAYIAFYRAVMNYDMTQHQVSFGLYAKICVENGLISALRKMRPLALPLDWKTFSTMYADDGESDPTRRLREQQDYEALCRVIARTLSPYENDIWQRYIAGATVLEIARQLGRDSRSIHNAIYRIRRKLRKTDGICNI